MGGVAQMMSPVLSSRIWSRESMLLYTSKKIIPSRSRRQCRIGAKASTTLKWTSESPNITEQRAARWDEYLVRESNSFSICLVRREGQRPWFMTIYNSTAYGFLGCSYRWLGRFVNHTNEQVSTLPCECDHQHLRSGLDQSARPPYRAQPTIQPFPGPHTWSIQQQPHTKDPTTKLYLVPPQCPRRPHIASFVLAIFSQHRPQA